MSLALIDQETQRSEGNTISLWKTLYLVVSFCNARWLRRPYPSHPCSRGTPKPSNMWRSRIYIYIYIIRKPSTKTSWEIKHFFWKMMELDRIIIAYFGKQLIGACTCSKGRFGAMTYKTHLETVLPGRPTKCCFSLVQIINYHYDFRNSVCFIIIHYHYSGSHSIFTC